MNTEALILTYSLLRKLSDLHEQEYVADPLNVDHPHHRLVLFADGSGHIDASAWNADQGWHTYELFHFHDLGECADKLIDQIQKVKARQASKQ